MVIYHLTENTKKSHMFRFGHMLRTHFSALLFSLQIPEFVAFKMDRFLGCSWHISSGNSPPGFTDSIFSIYLL